jgi:hypothetical protein
VLSGTAVALAASCALVYLVDPMAFSQYLQMIRTLGLEAEFIPCLSTVLRLWVNEKATRIQYVAPAIACSLALTDYWRHRHA